MNALKLNRSQTLIYGLPLVVVLSSIVIALSPLLKQYPALAVGITYDLALTAPLLFLVLSRKSRISKLRAVPFFIGGIAIATFLLPESGQVHLNFIKTYVLPIIELTVLAVLISKISKAVRVYKSRFATSADFLVVSKKSALELFGPSKFSAFLASEIGMFYYALIAWKKRRPFPNTFTNYKENGSIALAGAFLMVIFIETFALHILLAKWNVIAAWFLTATSIYTALMVFAHIKALLQRPSVLSDENLILKNGLIADIHIPLSAIEKIKSNTKELKSDNLKIGNLGLSKESTNHNIALHFKKPQTIEKMYGFTEECDVLLIHIDDRNVFVEKVNKAKSKL